MKRILSLLLSFVLLLSVFPMTGHASDVRLIPVESELPGSDELFAGYVEQVFYGGASTFGTAAGRQLTGDMKLAYDAMVPVIRQIASGQRSDTIFRMGQSAYDGSTTYTPDLSVTFTGGAPSSAAILNLVYALLSDIPYELYWFDKTQGFYFSPVVSSSGVLKYLEIGFVAADAYAVSTYKTNTATTSAASGAAANARAIVDSYAASSDYDKLQAYCRRICDLVDYNYAAVNDPYTPYGDPWQLIHVFDGDSSTNVVCEGYSKAFMYLCDLSSFSGETAAYTVGGYMDGGAHMWNIVTIDGGNYLVDVTNFDVGYDLFLVGGSGSVSSGYNVLNILYSYDSYTTNLWGTGSDSILKLSASDYVGHDFGDWVRTVEPTITSEGRETRTCGICGYTETRTVEPLKLTAPKISSSVNTATGKPRVKWSAVGGADYYRIYRSSTKTGTYTYLKSTSSTSYTDTTAKVGKNYYYKVRALNEETGKLSGYSNIVNRVCDLKKPDVTLKVDTASGKPKVTWVDMSGAIEYNIYRSTSKSSGFSLLKTSTSTSYIDTGAKVGTNYYYKVKAIHTNSAANSAYSDVVNRVCDLAKPVVTITRKSGDPYIKWDTVPGAEKYYIYRATSASGEYTRVKTAIAARTYTDTSAKAGKTYYYKVKAIHSNSSANSAYSTVRYITAK